MTAPMFATLGASIGLRLAPAGAPLAPPTPRPSPSTAPSATPTPDCLRASDLCHYVYEHTHQAWLASSSYYVLVKPLRIALIVLIAILVRHLLHRMIRRLIQGTATAVPAVLRPLKERLPNSIVEAAAIFPERRRQRAEAIGSVLRSFTTVVVYSIAALLILGEFQVNLAPLLASAGIVGVALGFGAQSLVKDLIAGLFMLLEDQYGVGDAVDVGTASGTVESVGLRITTIRDGDGVLWYIRNGEIVRVGNKSQGSAIIVIDVPVKLGTIDRAIDALRDAATGMGEDPAWHDEMIDPPQVLGVEQITADGAVVRTSATTPPQARARVGRELRRRLTEALAAADAEATGPARMVGDEPIRGEPADGGATPRGEAVNGGVARPTPPPKGA